MDPLGTKLRTCEGDRIAFWCPGCDDSHVIKVKGEFAWFWDGNVEAPTFEPSILVRQGDAQEDPRCHSFVRAGRIEFLVDCTHKLAGQTVDLPPWIHPQD